MKNIMILLCLLALMIVPIYAANYAGEIFLLAPGVSNQAMGGTGLTNSASLSAGWWNPALLDIADQCGLDIMYSEHFEGLLRQNQASIVFGNTGSYSIEQSADGTYLVGDDGRRYPQPGREEYSLPTRNMYSLIINHLSINNIKLTELENPDDSLSNENRPIVWKTIGNNDIIIHGAISRNIGSWTSIGIAPKLAYRSLAENSGYAFGADLGFLYAHHALRFGANLRDFFSSHVLWENGTYENVLPSLDLEGAYSILLGRSENAMLLDIAVRSQIFADDRETDYSLEMGPLSADMHLGLKFRPMNALAVLAGYDADALTAGLSIYYKRMGLDYAFKASSPDGLGSTQKISLNYKW